MARPKNSCYRSHRLIRERLLKGPLWLGDWRSTGIKSRSTVHKRLKYLASLGLVQKTRKGHRILYSIVPAPAAKRRVVTFDEILQLSLWNSLCEKTTRKMKRQLRREIRKLGADFGKIAEKITEMLEHPKTQELLTCLSEIGVDIEELPVFPDARWIGLLLLPHLNDQLCLECLRPHRRIVYNITDNQTGEIICPFCGTVKNDKTSLTAKGKRFLEVYSKIQRLLEQE